MLGCTMHIAQKTIHYTVYTIHYTLYTAQCTLHYDGDMKYNTATSPNFLFTYYM